MHRPYGHLLKKLKLKETHRHVGTCADSSNEPVDGLGPTERLNMLDLPTLVYRPAET